MRAIARRPLARSWRTSRIALRLFAFNLLILFLPVAGVLYLDVYEARLLEAQERAMVQQARLLAAALGDRAVLDETLVAGVIDRLERRTDARIRVYGSTGLLLADSARHAPPAPPDASGRYDEVATGTATRDRLLYRVGVWGERARNTASGIWRSIFVRSHEATTHVMPPGGVDPEVQAALAGRYGAAIRRTPGQRSLTMHSAVPIRQGGGITGVVLVSQSTFRILQALYEVRLRVFEVVVASAIAAALLTTIAAMTIVRPLTRLRRQAVALAEHRGPVPHPFPETGRRDELGDLARALEELTRRLNDHIRLLESFAADVSHEFRNPLASIRTAAEMMAQAENVEDRDRFLALMTRDVERLDRLVSGVRELARIDGQLEHERVEVLDLGALLHDLVQGLRLGAPSGRSIEFRGADEPSFVRGSSERLSQVFENLISNALSFSPPGTSVLVGLRSEGDAHVISVEDRGPGIPDGHMERVFDRFFTYRPTESRRQHVGLGLSIARTIVEGYGGGIRASNRDDGGARFEVRLKAAPAPRAVV